MIGLALKQAQGSGAAPYARAGFKSLNARSRIEIDARSQDQDFGAQGPRRAVMPAGAAQSEMIGPDPHGLSLSAAYTFNNRCSRSQELMTFW
jgi:hypothetical protein